MGLKSTYAAGIVLNNLVFGFGGCTGGDGFVIVRYGGVRISVAVEHRELRKGWNSFIRSAHIVSGTAILVAHSVGRTLSILKFKRGNGMKSIWDSNANPFDSGYKTVMSILIIK
ncbi:hypothetical protein Leryth_006172 [Lithospermum erythrorhizon]|nr:hypothetical protein Leryth_006172 [Lithospermum erythrorhizon]